LKNLFEGNYPLLESSQKLLLIQIKSENSRISKNQVIIIQQDMFNVININFQKIYEKFEMDVSASCITRFFWYALNLSKIMLLSLHFNPSLDHDPT
jgi:hypothetical protein